MSVVFEEVEAEIETESSREEQGLDEIESETMPDDMERKIEQAITASKRRAQRIFAD